jgi:hypothetical protein
MIATSSVRVQPSFSATRIERWFDGSITDTSRGSAAHSRTARAASVA